MAAGRALLGPVVAVGESCAWSAVTLAWLVVTAVISDILDAFNLEGIVMSLMLPEWRRDGKTWRAAWTMRDGTGKHGTAEQERRAPVARTTAVAVSGVAVLALCVLTVPALALEPGQAAYAGGTAKIALDTPGTLDTTSPTELVFRYTEANGTPGEIAIAYAKIRNFEPRNDVVRHLGFLPALGAGLVAARQRRYTLAISYTDASDAMQVAILQVAERDQQALETTLRARAPKSCMVTQYSNSCPMARPVPAPAATATATPVPASVPPAVK